MRRTSRRITAVAMALALVAAACTRSSSDVGEEADAPDEDVAAPAETSDDPPEPTESRLDQAAFGDLEGVCGSGGDGAQEAEEEIGLTADEIRLGTITDKGSTDRPGLNQEMHDVAVAFAAWCNEHGGIQGRQIVVDDLDTRLFEYGDRIAEACRTNFALVGGGGVFDNQGLDERIACELPNFPGFMVTPEARDADLQVQPIPNPTQEFQVGTYRTLRERDPDLSRFGIIWPDIGEGPAAIRAQLRDAVERLGYDVVYDEQFRVIGETGWRGFVQQMRAADVQVVELIGEPESMVSLQSAMQVEGWTPDYVTLQANMFDDRYAAEGATSVVDNTYIRVPFPTFDMADEVPAMADFLELMERYNPEGKVALLGAHTLSAYLLFATAANRCGDELSRTCVLDETATADGWTAGGLHSPHQPGNTVATECSVLIRVTADGFVYDEELTQPNEGIYNCDPDHVVDVSAPAGGGS